MNDSHTPVPSPHGVATDNGTDPTSIQFTQAASPGSAVSDNDSCLEKPRPKGRGKGKGRKPDYKGKKIEFRLVPEEAQALKERALEASMTVSEFCRRASSGKRIISRYDYEVTRRLAELHGDQARLGNLFKASLDKDHRAYSQSDKASIRTLLINLEKNQESISRILREVEDS